MNDYEDMLIDALDLFASQDLPDEMLTDVNADEFPRLFAADL